MEARAELRQPRISKGLVAIVALSVTLGLGVMAGTVAKNLNGSATTTTQSHSVSQGLGGSAIGTLRHGGMQSVEENAPISTAVGPDDRVGSPALAPIAGRGVSPDAADRKAGLVGQLTVASIGASLVPNGVQTIASDAANHQYQTWSAPKLSGNAFVAPDAADHKSQAAPASKPAFRFMPDAPGYREG
jgi:hypothetical protein